MEACDFEESNCVLDKPKDNDCTCLSVMKAIICQ